MHRAGLRAKTHRPLSLAPMRRTDRPPPHAVTVFSSMPVATSPAALSIESASRPPARSACPHEQTALRQARALHVRVSTRQRSRMSSPWRRAEISEDALRALIRLVDPPSVWDPIGRDPFSGPAIASVPHRTTLRRRESPTVATPLPTERSAFTCRCAASLDDARRQAAPRLSVDRLLRLGSAVRRRPARHRGLPTRRIFESFQCLWGVFSARASAGTVGFVG